MAVQKIDYEDKVQLQNDENVPNKNKVTDNDMNEIKSKVNNNADELSTAQQNIEDLQKGQGTASSDITALNKRVSTLEVENTKNKQDISNKVDKVEGKGLSANDFTNELKTKLEELNNYDDKEIKADIQELQSKNEKQDKKIETIEAEQQTQNNLIENTQGALINITTEKADSLIVKDASNLNAKVKLFGISKQKTREGYNILNYDSLESRTINGITFTINEDRSITANGTATANATLNLVRRSWKLSTCIRSRRLYIKWLRRWIIFNILFRNIRWKPLSRLSI